MSVSGFALEFAFVPRDTLAWVVVVAIGVHDGEPVRAGAATTSSTNESSICKARVISQLVESFVALVGALLSGRDITRAVDGVIAIVYYSA